MSFRVVAAACVVGVGCSRMPEAARVCTMELRSTITVRVYNAVTGAVESPGATVVVRGGAVYDSVIAPATAGEQAYVAWEDKVRGGSYTITVRKPGFTDWTGTAEVKQDECHAGPGPLVDARLQPK